MHATIRRYEGVDMTRTNEVTSKIKQTLVTKWIADEKFNSVIPNPPKITSGKVVAYSDGVAALV